MSKEYSESRVAPAEPKVLRALHQLMRTYNGLHADHLRNTPEGHWVNEAFVIRLWAVLLSHRVVTESKKIDKDLEGWVAVDICRRLRHEFSHATGEISDNNARGIAAKIHEVFGVDSKESVFEGRFVLSKDKVLRPIFHQVVIYCKSLLIAESHAGLPPASEIA
jgi:hypothetical protein